MDEDEGAQRSEEEGETDAGAAAAEAAARLRILEEEDQALHGLENEDGENNCFLNAAIQTLWHVRSFRKAIFAAPEHRHNLTSSPAGDYGLTVQDTCCYCALKVLFMQYRYSSQATLPPDSLRVAMSHIYSTRGRFQLGAMEDATETIEALLDVLHASTVSSSSLERAAAGAEDTETEQESKDEPEKEAETRAPAASASGSTAAAKCCNGSACSGSTGASSSLPVTAVASEGSVASTGSDADQVSTPNGGNFWRRRRRTVTEVLEDASHFPCQPPCIAHAVFGIEYVDIPCCTFCGCTWEPVVAGSYFLQTYVAELKALHDELSRTPSSASAARPAAGGPRSAEPSPPPRLPGDDWPRSRPDLQRLLWMTHHRSLPEQRCIGCNSVRTVISERWLTVAPRTLLLSLAWPTPRPADDMVTWMLSATRPMIAAGQVFTSRLSSPTSKAQAAPVRTVSSAATSYAFCGMICYKGMHYIAIAWCWPRRKWILFDDTFICEKPNWSSVVRWVIQGHFVPTLLIYDQTQPVEEDPDYAAAIAELNNQFVNWEDPTELRCTVS
eukprot:TRINITY_DN22878_c0_g1_i1.p1 TRINITY_DN22878_c0_g1~~TRINITY_DN22878_c0_g1_i1.p1  ORF type:complete len:618 (+),score=119.42 TRINITY_DN22878_c0_g1_i1:189-1856(+)